MHTVKITASWVGMDIVEGALLGDGTINNGTFLYASKSLDHVNFVWRHLLNVMSPKNKNNVSEVYQFDKRTNKTYHRFFFNSQANECFKQLRQKWYKSKKIIPNDLILNNLICLVWYLGDGSINPVGGYIRLSTNGFLKMDIENVLIPQLKEFQARMAKTEKKGQYIIIIPRIETQKFLRYIGECPVNDYLYKWKLVKYKHKKEFNK